jgi:hypothetical protein
LNKGTLLVEARNEKQAEVLLKASLLGSHLVHVERHTLLNSSRGVIHTDSLDGMSDEEIQSALADQLVSLAYRLIGKRDNRPFPPRTTFLTFKVPSLPAYLHVGYETVAVRLYVRCYGVRSLDILNRGVLLTLSGVSAVKVGMVRSHAPTNPNV